MITLVRTRRVLAAAALLAATVLAVLGDQPATASAGSAAAETACVSQPFNPKDPTAPLIRCCPPDSECTQFPPRVDLPPTAAGRSSADLPDVHANCDDADEASDICVRWCPTNPGGGGGYYPCGVGPRGRLAS